MEGKYFLQTALDLTSCHIQVVPRVIPLMLCGPLIAQMVMSVTRQVVQVGLCTCMTRASWNRSVFLLGRYASTKEAGISGLCADNQTGASVYCITVLFGRDVSLCWLYILREAVFSLGVFLFQFFSFLLLIYYYFFSKSTCLPVFINNNFLIICACFPISNF